MVGLIAVWKYLTSYLKSDWTLGDYPISIRHFDVTKIPPSPRAQPIVCAATIFGWWLSGGGDTRDEALAQLKDHFEKYKKEGPLPRPGTRKPLEFAASNRIGKHQHLVPGFCMTIFGLPSADGVFISDKSTIWDFHSDETNEAMIRKIQEHYHVDVTDLADEGNIASILERIEQSKK